METHSTTPSRRFRDPDDYPGVTNAGWRILVFLEEQDRYCTEGEIRAATGLTDPRNAIYYLRQHYPGIIKGRRGFGYRLNKETC